MSIWNSALYTAQSPQGGYSLNANPGFPVAKNAQGKLRIVQVPYTINGSEAANDIINLTTLKAGTRVLSARSKLVAQNPGTTLTLAVGDTSNTGRYANGLTLSNTAFDKEFSQNVGTDTYVPTDIVIGNPPSSIADQGTVVAKVLTAASLTAGQKLLFLLAIVDE